MVRVKPFAAIRPPKNLVTEVAAPPYDVLNSAEANVNAGLAAARQIVDFFATGNCKFQVNK